MSEMACTGRVDDPACVSSSPPLSPSPPSPFSPAAIAIIAVLGVAFLVVSYYTIISKFCPPWGRLWGSRRSSLRRRGGGSSSAMEARWVEAGGGAIIWPVFPTRGLEESAIRAIPILQHCRKKSADGGSLAECAVCLGELADGEWLRQLPQCRHSFHIACIDEWLQSHSSCPLCRAGVLSHAASLENRQISPQSSDLTDSSSLAVPPDPPVNLVVAAVAPPPPLPELQSLNNPIPSISHSERYTAIPNGSNPNHLQRSYSTSFLNESTDPALMELRWNDPTLTRVNDDSSSILPLRKENGDGKPSAPPPNPSFQQTSLSDRKLFAFLSGNRFSSSSSSSWVRTSRTSGHVHPIDDSIV